MDDLPSTSLMSINGREAANENSEDLGQKSAYEVVREGIEPPFPHVPAVPVAPAKFGALFAAALIALALGFGIGWSASGVKALGWKEYVAFYQALHTNGTLVHVNQSDVAKQDELDGVSAANGKTTPVEALNVSPEVEYKRGQVLGFQAAHWCNWHFSQAPANR